MLVSERVFEIKGVPHFSHNIISYILIVRVSYVKGFPSPREKVFGKRLHLVICRKDFALPAGKFKTEGDFFVFFYSICGILSGKFPLFFLHNSIFGNITA